MADRFRMDVPPPRPQMEILRAHNLLLEVFADKRLADEIIPDDDAREDLHMALDCLCWVLHHDVDFHRDCHASHFASILQYVQTEIAELDAKIGAGPPFPIEEE